jgi:DNA modification methylase
MGPQHQVLDPFCGTGTTVVECKKLGIPSVGVEANPMAHFASQVKANWQPDPETLIAHAQQVAAGVRAELLRTGIDDSGFGPLLPLFQQQEKDLPGLRTLPEEQRSLLVKGSISPLPLHKTLVLMEHLQRLAQTPYVGHERLALAKALVASIGNLHFGPEVGVGPAKPDVAVVDTWLATVGAIAQDLRSLQSLPRTTATIHHADSRHLRAVLEPGSIDAVITSPPYPNEKDYTRATRLESVLLGFIHNKAELRQLKQQLLRSNTRNVYKQDDDDQWVVDHAEIQQIAGAIEARRIELGKTSGFERQYARVTRLYFGGMACHLAELRTILRPGAQLAYVVGDQASFFRILIRTGQLLGDIAQALGYELVGIDLFRTRIATATREQLREEVVVLRWPG